jgi:hypothetical protein
MAHVTALAERIGPRPATTDSEAEAAGYIERQYRHHEVEVEVQEFECPRTYSWAYAAYHVLTILAAVLAGYVPVIAFVLAALVAIIMWSDLDTRWGLSALMPKGPSQNVIARRIPHRRREAGERRIVVVAHYDSAVSSLAFSPSMVKNFNLSFGAMKWATWLVAALALLGAIPLGFVESLQPWLWYVTMLISAYLLVPLFINVHREIVKKQTDGANDNASGVAVMLDVLARSVPETDAPPPEEPVAEPVVQGEEQAWAAEMVPDDALLTYSPATAPEAPAAEPGEEVEWSDSISPDDTQTSLDFEEAPPPGAGLYETGEIDAEVGGAYEEDEPKKRRWPFGRREKADDTAPSDWLGVEEGFDAREEGRKIGSWDDFDDSGDDDFGVRGGVGDFVDIDAPDFAASEAARIRRHVTQGMDRAVADKEIWFVATGAEEVGTWGMRALIRDFGDELEDAYIVNVDNVGSGNVAWITREGMAKRYRSDRRLLSGARRAATENEIRVKGQEYRGLSTDATPALARGYRAMSVMAFDINGRLPDWHWTTDTVGNVDESNLEVATEFVTALLREL